MKSSGVLSNLKSDYFFLKLFDNLLKKKTLDIIKYNNNLKDRLNININNYKEYSEIYSPIEIEIKPINNVYGKFICIGKKNEIYFHIYFNNNEEEIKRNYLDENEKIKIIKIIIDYQVISFEELFRYCKCIEYINFKKFFRHNITNMYGMFANCSSLKELNLSNFNTNNVTNMSEMFFECSKLKELNLSNFNTDNVTNMSSMFLGCSSLKELNLSNFNTNNVINMSGMFFECSSLKELNLSNFNTDNVTIMHRVFYGCSSLKELNLSNFNTNKETFMDGMFSKCSEQLKMKIKAKYKNIKEEAFK